MNYYLLKVQDIPTGGRNIVASSKSDDWLKKVLKDSVDLPVDDVEAEFQAAVTRIERSVDIVGGLYLKTKFPCDLCLEPVEKEEQIPLRFLLEPETAVKGKDKSEEDLGEDMNEILDFSYYNGSEIDLGDLVRQHVVMSRSIRNVCSEDCRGLCPHCGKNLNKKKCTCKAEKGETPFAVLKKLKKPRKS